MWISRNLLLLLSCCLLVAVAQAQEQGQYRSRIMLDPLGEMGKGSEMSVEELQREIDGIEDPYARSSAGRHLARHHVQQGDYQQAIQYYREALSAGGLAPVANREMLRELAQVYLLQEDYRSAAATLDKALAIPLAPEAADFLLLARARHELGDYVGVVDSLDRIAAGGLALDTAQQRQALALYYRAGAWDQCATLLQQLQAADPGEANYWHQLASVYLQQGKQREAQDVLVLARQKGIPFNDEETRLLVDLLAVNGNPYGAAQELQQALDSGRLPDDAANQRKLFELWLQAREAQRAEVALSRAARLSGDTELYLYLAQLQMEEQRWQAMSETVLAACTRQLEDRHVSRANLLLGVSQFHLGNGVAARRSFINATLVGGAHEQAGQWLAYMDAVPASEDELRRVEGPCFGSEGKQRALADAALPPERATSSAVSVQPVEVASATVTANALQVQSTPPLRLYYVEIEEPGDDLRQTLRGQALRLGATLTKAGGSPDGDPLLIREGEEGTWQLALPVRGNPQARGRYRSRRSQLFHYIARAFIDDPTLLPGAIAALQDDARDNGLALTGELRLRPQSETGAETSGLEIQLGVEP